MKLSLTPSEARERGMTHHALYYGIPVYLGNLEFKSKEPIEVMMRYWGTGFLFTCVSVIEWLCTPPNAGSMFLVGEEIS